MVKAKVLVVQIEKHNSVHIFSRIKKVTVLPLPLMFWQSFMVNYSVFNV